MGATVEKLDQIHNLITAGYTQEASLMIKGLLQQDPADYDAWELLAQVTTGAAKDLCLQKAEHLRMQSPKPNDDKTVPFTIEPRPRVHPQPASEANRKKVEPTPQKAPPADAHVNGSALLRWSAIAAAGIVLGILLIVFINQFFGGNQAAEALSGNEAELTAAIFDQRPSTDDDSNSVVVASATPTALETDVSEEDTSADSDIETSATLPPTNTPQPTLQQLAAKDVSDNEEGRDPWTPTPSPTPTNTPTPAIEPTRLTTSNTSFAMPNVGLNERWVDVNLTLQTLTAYEGNSPVFQTNISSGRAPYYTVTGQFRVYYRLESQTMDGRRLGFDYVTPGVPHVQYFYGDFAIHGATWHNDFGTPVSHGCVNVTPVDAEWLYNWMSYGTLVNVHY